MDCRPGLHGSTIRLNDRTQLLYTNLRVYLQQNEGQAHRLLHLSWTYLVAAYKPCYCLIRPTSCGQV